MYILEVVMIGIKILGAQGNRAEKSNTTCIQVSKNTLIDAGNIIQGLGKDAKYINNIFLSHSHLDHIIDSAFLIDNFFAQRDTPLKIYALSKTLETLKKHIFNWEIWPDFSNINLIKTKTPSMEFIPIEFYKEYKIEENITLIPIPSVHTVPTCGYIIKSQNGSILFSGDTFKNPDLWNLVNSNKEIKAVLIDVSFPNKQFQVAQDSKHLTPNFLQEDMTILSRKDVSIYINHLKPFYKKEIVEELLAVGFDKNSILKDGEIISFESGKIIERKTSDEEKINKLIKIGTALSAENNVNKLLEMIVEEAKSLTHSDGGTLYLLKDDELNFTVVQTDSLDIKMGGTHSEITWPALPLYLEDHTENNKMVAALCALENRVINIPDVYEEKGFSFDGTKKFDKSTGYKSKSMLVIPLMNHEKTVIGVLQLINKQNSLDKSTQVFNKEDENITLSLASQVAVALTNVMLIEGLENLLESFLKSIVYAMGKKSAHTAGHIKRMVKLSVMIAQKVDEDNGVFKDKKYTQEEIKQINIAALMHDIGKLTTPEQVVDKSRKLETIFDRIELIETRINLIKSALEVSFYKKKITQEYFENEILILDSDLEFMKRTNIGTEFLPDDEVIRVENIQKKNYTLEGKNYIILTEKESYNLSVQKGTLTKEERDIINDHAKVSVDILNKLPFPKKYAAIPEISGSHHEKINGTGYPLGLKGDEISFEARILAIADIFEALTASDRPYKKANPLSSAMKILYFMAKDDELDRDLVKFFYNSGLYLEYAHKSLPKSSIDEVSIDFNNL
jgi:HD-GYP domain-containing protein (c-di-GMP phosphodiesterase class II)/ribonuclease BN (tRNA processing enzyme)